ncbi:arginine--tRNA ligase, chloroplastic/mitochondrial-like protein isoform X2 [Tanacetum coccineum]
MEHFLHKSRGYYKWYFGIAVFDNLDPYTGVTIQIWRLFIGVVLVRLLFWRPIVKDYKLVSTRLNVIDKWLGLDLSDDGKGFRTRSTEVVKLIDLLDEAKTRKATLVERGRYVMWTDEELEQTAAAVGYGVVKYAELKNNRLTNYKFNYDQMLNDKLCVMALSYFQYDLHIAIYCIPRITYYLYAWISYATISYFAEKALD